MKTKFIFVTGGVVSSLGKGISASSIGQLLKLRGLKVFMQKFDPYINVDPGQMSPLQHGEVFVTDDGAETDLDLGHYERFIDERLNKYSSVTSGKVYLKVIENERNNKYSGKTVQVIPHITDEIKRQLKKAAKYSNADVVIAEIGGTVGDIESLPFLEAIRQCKREFGSSNTLYVHNTLVPILRHIGEVKTKPTQHSVKALMSLGITPDMLVLRSEKPLGKELRMKISSSCDVDYEGVFEAVDVDIIFENIIKLHDQKVDDFILNKFGIKAPKKVNLKEWKDLIQTIKNTDKELNIALVGKYVALKDAYLSVNESLKYAGYHNNTKINISWINCKDINKKNVSDIFKNIDAIIVPGGFGNDASDSIIPSGEISKNILDEIDCMVEALKYGRQKNIPTFGICFGMQIMAIEFARNVLNLKDSNTKHFLQFLVL